VSHFEGSPASTSTSNHTRPGCRHSWIQVPSGDRAARICFVLTGENPWPPFDWFYVSDLAA